MKCWRTPFPVRAAVATTVFFLMLSATPAYGSLDQHIFADDVSHCGGGGPTPLVSYEPTDVNEGESS